MFIGDISFRDILKWRHFVPYLFYTRDILTWNLLNEEILLVLKINLLKIIFYITYC